nr:hypothetical protein [uncultured Holophaga sp.]
MSTLYDQSIGDRLGSRYLHPDLTPREFCGRWWSRTHPLCCPHCQNVFYAWQPEDQPFEPYRNPSGMRGTDGGRQTCGHPLCEKAERKEVALNTPAYLATVEGTSTHEDPTRTKGNGRRGLSAMGESA